MISITIYIVLIIFILLLTSLARVVYPDKEKQDKVILTWGIIAIFLILSLKKYTVGTDVAAYMYQYKLAQWKAWKDVDYIYFEKGYILLNKIFSRMGIDFQLFLGILYAYFCFVLHRFIAKYSKNVTLSLLIFICYQFFVFSISAVRQMLAMAICLHAYLIFSKQTVRHFLVSVFFVWIATQIHQSAVIFYLVLFVGLKKTNKINLGYFLVGIAATRLLRPYIWRLVASYFERDYGESGGALLGGNFIFLCAMCAFFYITIQLCNGKIKSRIEWQFSQEIQWFDVFCARILALTTVSYIVLSGSSMLRATMYLTLFMIPGVPNFIEYYEFKLKTGMNYAISILMIILFYVDTLVPGQLELTPYLFFWQG